MSELLCRKTNQHLLAKENSEFDTMAVLILLKHINALRLY